MTEWNYRWRLSDLDRVSKNGAKVLSTFSCGGGSTAGYKLAGCDVIAANDIDPEMAENYKRNFSPQHYFLMPINQLVDLARARALPAELYELDILDGSPPCSTFSTAGSRDKKWGQETYFREGQSAQVLDDLFFDFLNLADVLRPKVIVAENVKGMIIGTARGYTHLVIQRFREMGYIVQMFLLNAADCGVPQKRERLFFVAHRNDLTVPRLRLAPAERWVTAKEAIGDLLPSDMADYQDCFLTPGSSVYLAAQKALPGEGLDQSIKRRTNSRKLWSWKMMHPDLPSLTLAATQTLLHWSMPPRLLTFQECVRLGSFPSDYDPTTLNLGKYMIGMSVPPLMAAHVAQAICTQWLAHG